MDQAQSTTETESFVTVNNVKIHYIDHGGDGPVLVFIHGLTANANAFDAIAAGLTDKYRVICPDLRGNGQSDKPAFSYSMENHAQDVLGFIRQLGQTKVYLGGLSFGGYVAFYIAANYPAVVERLVILDAAKAMNHNAMNMLSAAFSRLDVTYPNFDAYIEHVKKLAYINFWDAAMVSYYRADVKDLPDGGVKARCNLMTITEKSIGLSKIDWINVILRVKQPTILINALDVYTMGEPLLPDEIARETVEMMKDAKYYGVDGNHLTMLYGAGARQIIRDIRGFLPAA